MHGTPQKAVRRPSPGFLSLALSLVLHTLALAAPIVVNSFWRPAPPSSLLPRGGGQPVSIEWVELEAPPPIRKISTAKLTPAAEVPVPDRSPKVEMAAPKRESNPAQSLSTAMNSPSEKSFTLGSPEGLSTEALAYHDELYLLFESRKTYPLAARRLNQQGEVLISMRIWANGKIDDQRVIKPSPYSRLNEAALGMVRQVGHFKPLPKDSGPYAYFHLPIEYSLN